MSCASDPFANSCRCSCIGSVPRLLQLFQQFIITTFVKRFVDTARETRVLIILVPWVRECLKCSLASDRTAPNSLTSGAAERRESWVLSLDCCRHSRSPTNFNVSVQTDMLSEFNRAIMCKLVGTTYHERVAPGKLCLQLLTRWGHDRDTLLWWWYPMVIPGYPSVWTAHHGPPCARRSMCDHHYPTPSQKFLTVIISIVVITIATLPDNKSVLGEQNGTEPEKRFIKNTKSWWPSCH